MQVLAKRKLAKRKHAATKKSNCRVQNFSYLKDLMMKFYLMLGTLVIYMLSIWELKTNASGIFATETRKLASNKSSLRKHVVKK